MTQPFGNPGAATARHRVPDLARIGPGLVSAGALVAVAGFGFAPVFVGSLLVLVVPAVAVPVGLVALLRRAALPVSALTSLLALLVVATATVERAAPTPGALRGLLDSAVNGWARVLDTTTPMPQRPELMALVPVLVWLATYVSAELVVRSGARLLLLLPSALVLVVTLVFAGGAGSVAAQALLGGGFLLAAAGVLAARGWRSGTTAVASLRGPRRIALAAAVLLPAVLLAAGLGGSVAQPPGQPFDVRQYRDAALDQTTGQNPLDLVSTWSSNPDDVLFSVAAQQPQNWRLAVLDDFDGATWSSQAHYAPAGLDLDPQHRATQPAQTLDARVTLGDLPGRWLPAAERPVRISGARADVDPATGTLLSADALRPGLTYTVRSELPTRTPAQLVGAVPATDGIARAHLTLAPGLPAELRRAATTAVGSSRLPVQKALLLEQYLRTNFKYDPQAPPGHTYAHLRFFLTSSQAGTSEQFATAFAVMARTIGLPSRVVVGFTSGNEQGHPGTFDVHSGDVLAWPELDFGGLGWVPFYPTPSRGSQGAAKSPAGQSQAQAALVQQVSSAINRPTATPPSAPPAVPARSGQRTALVVGGFVVGALVLLWGAVALWALRRRRQRRMLSAAASERVAAAWRYALDVLRDAGYADTQSLTTGRAADAAHSIEPLGQVGDTLQALGRLVDRALFDAAGVGTPDAERAWELADSVAAALRPQIPRARRVRSALVPY